MGPPLAIARQAINQALWRRNRSFCSIYYVNSVDIFASLEGNLRNEENSEIRDRVAYLKSCDNWNRFDCISRFTLLSLRGWFPPGEFSIWLRSRPRRALVCAHKTFVSLCFPVESVLFSQVRDWKKKRKTLVARLHRNYWSAEFIYGVHFLQIAETAVKNFIRLNRIYHLVW